MEEKDGKYQLTDEDKMHIDSIAGRRLLDLLEEDDGARETMMENKDECIRIFMAGCQAGVFAYGKMLEREVFRGS